MLDAASASSPSDAWAVGRITKVNKNESRITTFLAFHWNGTSWVTTTIPVINGSDLLSVADISPTGMYDDNSTAALEPFTAHFNGTAWTSVRVPVNGGQFFGLTVVKSSDTWMVGYSSTGGSLIEHWNGSSWRVVPSPGTGGLLSVTATSAANVSAVGGNGQEASVLVWNGSVWTAVAVPQVGDSEALYSTFAALGGQLTWAFGRSTTGEVVSELTLLNG
jgi:hypothetical protein